MPQTAIAVRKVLMAIINSCIEFLLIIPCERKPLCLDYCKSVSIKAVLCESLSVAVDLQIAL